MSYPVINLKRGKEESLKRFHPWVFSGAIARMSDNSIPEGTVVEIQAADGTPLGVGHYQIGSIAVRILSPQVETIDRDFYSRRLAEAWRMRRTLGLVRPDNTAYRLVHGEGDFLPGLIVDVYGDTAVMQAHSPGIHDQRMVIAEALTLLDGAGIANVYYKSETTLPYKAGCNPRDGFLIGTTDTNIATENGLDFHIDWLKGQKTGFFIDQRENRALLRHYAAGRRVLNMFCYTGGFSVAALRGGAEKVTSVDSSAKAIALTDANIALNFPAGPAGLPADGRHTSVAEDAFKFLGATAKGEYDLIVLDPPAFAKHRDAIRNALRGYQRLNAIGIEKVAPGGLIFTFSCSQAITKEQFRLAVFSAAAQTGRRVRILHQLTQPADHPVNIYHPEGEYLKGLILYVE